MHKQAGRKAASMLAVVVFACTSGSNGQSIILDKNEDRVFSQFNWIPYAFYSGSFGLGLGVGAGYNGWPQEQASVLGAVTLGTRGSYNVLGSMSDFQMPEVSGGKLKAAPGISSKPTMERSFGICWFASAAA